MNGAVCLVGEHHDGSAPLFTDIIAANWAHKRLITGRPSYMYTDIKESFVMQSLNTLAEVVAMAVFC